LDDQAFHQYQLEQFRQMASRLTAASESPGGENLALLAQQCGELAAEPAELLDQGAPLLHRLMTAAPGLATMVPRDLLWYLGGECLHFMPDEEIERLSALDEDRREAAALGRRFDWASALANAPTLQ
jgi:hypothetical protein